MRFSLSLFLPILDSDCPTADFPGNTIDQQMYNKNVICQIEQQCWIEQQQTEESDRKAVSRPVQCIQFPNSTLNVCRAAVVGNLQIEKCFQRFKNQLKLTDWLTEDEQLNSKTQKKKRCMCVRVRGNKGREGGGGKVGIKWSAMFVCLCATTTTKLASEWFN